MVPVEVKMILCKNIERIIIIIIILICTHQWSHSKVWLSDLGSVCPMIRTNRRLGPVGGWWPAPRGHPVSNDSCQWSDPRCICDRSRDRSAHTHPWMICLVPHSPRQVSTFWTVCQTAGRTQRWNWARAHRLPVIQRNDGRN